MQSSDNLHFLSPTTGISMLLPIGWEEKDFGDDYIIYFNDTDGEELDPRIFIKKISIPKVVDNLQIKLLEDFLNIERKDFEYLDGGSIEIDGKQGAYAEIQYLEENTSQLVYAFQLYLMNATKIFSFTFMCGVENTNKWMADFKIGINSIRVIE